MIKIINKVWVWIFEIAIGDQDWNHDHWLIDVGNIVYHWLGLSLVWIGLRLARDK